MNTRESYDHSLVKHPGSHKRHSFSWGAGGSVVGRWDVFDLAVPIVFHMIFSNIFWKCSHPVSIILPTCPQLSQMSFKWFSEGYANLFMEFVCFHLSCWDLPNHDTSFCVLGIVGKPSMRWGTSNWFHNVSTYVGEVIEYCVICVIGYIHWFWKETISWGTSSHLGQWQKVTLPT